MRVTQCCQLENFYLTFIILNRSFPGKKKNFPRMYSKWRCLAANHHQEKSITRIFLKIERKKKAEERRSRRSNLLMEKASDIRSINAVKPSLLNGISSIITNVTPGAIIPAAFLPHHASSIFFPSSLFSIQRVTFFFLLPKHVSCQEGLFWLKRQARLITRLGIKWR